MQGLTRRSLVAAGVGASCLAAFAQSGAAGFPARPLNIVVPFPPGGATDLMARTLGQRFTKAWGQPVTVENKPGAGGMIAASQVLKAPADGHTLFFGASAQLAVNQSLYKNVPYEVARDFAPIGLVGSVPNILVAHPSTGFSGLADLIKAAKQRPGKLEYASPGSGSTAHLAMELFKGDAQVDILHVPYKGAAGAVTDVLGNQVPMLIVSMPSVISHVRSGRLLALGVTSAQRSPALPDVPTFAELMPGFEATGWYGLLAPTGTSAGTLAMIHAEIQGALQDPAVKVAFAEHGLSVLGGSSSEFATYIRSESKKWAAVISKAGIKVE